MNGSKQQAPMELDGMHLGDVNNYQPPAPPRKPVSGLLIGGIAAAAGILAGPAIMDYVNSRVDHPTPPPAVIQSDEDTLYDLQVTVGK